MGTIYCASNQTNGKRYIGQTVNFKNRKSQHRSRLVKQTHGNPRMQEDYNSGHKFDYVFLESCSDADMLQREGYYMWLFQTLDPRFGYNTVMADGRRTDETKTRMRENHADFSGGKHPMCGRKQSEQAKANMRAAHRRASGEDHPSSKLTNAQRREICEKYSTGVMRQDALAKEYGVCRTSISAITRAKERWM